MSTLVSIAIPCYNAEQWIAASVQSALDQTWPDKEILVADDGSTDGTLAVLKKFGDAIRVIPAPHTGANHARNLLLQAAQGRWIQYLDADDYLRSEKIERQFDEAGRTTDIDVIYSPVLIENWKDGHPLPLVPEPIDTSVDIYTQLFRWQLPQTSGSLWRRSVLQEIGGWDEKPTQLCDEHDCYFRALTAGHNFAYAPTPNAVYRIWSEETRSHRNERPVILSRTALCEELRDWLRDRGLWTPQHQRALGQAFLEMARTLASHDLGAAASYEETRRQDIRLAGPAAPGRYQFIYRALGFRAAELLARALRS